MRNHATAFSGDYADAEIAYYQRRTATERKLLELIYAPNGNTRQGVQLAATTGVSASCFLHREHVLLWDTAAEASSTALAVATAREMQRRGVIMVLSVAELVDSWFWCPHILTATARGLMTMIAAEREAKLCARRYAGLLDGTIAPTISATTIPSVKAA